MDYFKKKTANELSDLHNQAFANTSKATKVTFYQSMRRIEKIYDMSLPEIELEFLNKPDKFIEMLTTSTYSENTKLTTITNILKLLKIIDAPLITYNKWLNILKSRTEARQQRDNLILKKKLQVLMDYTDIRDVVKKKAEEFIVDNPSFEDYQEFLLLALFTLQIPVRIGNYVKMKVIDDLDGDNDDNFNYLYINDDEYRLIFNKYRTSHLLGKKTMYIKNENLQYLIDKWLTNYNKNSPNFLIIDETNKRSLNGKQIQLKIANITEKLFGSSLTIDNIRSSYMKYVNELDPNFQDKLDIANILGYSTNEVMDKHT